MKKPDLNNFLPIDKLKLFQDNSLLEIEIDLGTIVCRINHDKINYDFIDSLSSFQQEESMITLEKIVDKDKFKKSNSKEGFDDFEIELSKIGNIKILERI